MPGQHWYGTENRDTKGERLESFVESFSAKIVRFFRSIAEALHIIRPKDSDLSQREADVHNQFNETVHQDERAHNRASEDLYESFIEETHPPTTQTTEEESSPRTVEVELHNTPNQEEMSPSLRRAFQRASPPPQRAAVGKQQESSPSTKPPSLSPASSSPNLRRASPQVQRAAQQVEPQDLKKVEKRIAQATQSQESTAEAVLNRLCKNPEHTKGFSCSVSP